MQYSDMASAASPASLQFGHQLVTSLIPAAEGGIAVAGAAQAVLSPLSVWFALVLLLNGVGELPESGGRLGNDDQFAYTIPEFACVPSP
jgi:hypothetical protein